MTPTTVEPDKLAHQLNTRLRNLLQRKTMQPNYLQQFDALKNQADQLPCTQRYLSIKRLCAAGLTIPTILTELPNEIVAFACGEAESIKLLNPLLLDIIDADLISAEKKELLIHLVEATLLDPNENLPTSEKRRLDALKKCLSGDGDNNDRAAFIQEIALNPHRFTSTTLSITGEKQDESAIRYLH